MTAVKLETQSLFVRPDEDLSSIVPKFTDVQIRNMQHIHEELYHISLGAGGEGIRYSIHLPSGKIRSEDMEVYVCRVDGERFYGNYVGLINEYTKAHPETEQTRWIRQNVRELNIAKSYWEAVNLREIAELNNLTANLRALDAKAYSNGKDGLTKEEVKLAVIEFGYDPDKSWGFE